MIKVGTSKSVLQLALTLGVGADMSCAPRATVPMVSGYLTDPIMQAIILIDETCLDFDLFVGCQAAGGMEGDVLTEDLLIQFAKNILTARHGKPCLVPSAWVWTWAGLAVSARFDRQSDIQTHDWIE